MRYVDKGLSIENLYRRGNDNIRTPKWFYDRLNEEFHFDAYDPCPENPEGMREFDGLSPAPYWVRCYYINPPYSNVLPWIFKAIGDKERGVTVVMLLKFDPSTKWFLPVFEHCGPILGRLDSDANLRFITGRLDFTGEGGVFPNLLAIFRAKVQGKVTK